MHKTAQVAREAIRDGMSVVIGLQSTGEANTNATREESGDVLEDFVSAPKVIMQQFLEKQFPREARDRSGAELRKLLFQVWPPCGDGRLVKSILLGEMLIVTSMLESWVRGLPGAQLSDCRA